MKAHNYNFGILILSEGFNTYKQSRLLNLALLKKKKRGPAFCIFIYLKKRVKETLAPKERLFFYINLIIRIGESLPLLLGGERLLSYFYCLFTLNKNKKKVAGIG